MVYKLPFLYFYNYAMHCQSRPMDNVLFQCDVILSPTCAVHCSTRFPFSLSQEHVFDPIAGVDRGILIEKVLDEELFMGQSASDSCAAPTLPLAVFKVILQHVSLTASDLLPFFRSASAQLQLQATTKLQASSRHNSRFTTGMTL